MNDLNQGRLNTESETITCMISLYCRKKHSPSGKAPCRNCQELLNFCLYRLQRCPYGDAKPTCKNCAIQCYKGKKDCRQEVRQIMKFSGPRMILYHPFLAFQHSFDQKFRKSVAL